MRVSPGKVKIRKQLRKHEATIQTNEVFNVGAGVLKNVGRLKEQWDKNLHKNVCNAVRDMQQHAIWLFVLVKQIFVSCGSMCLLNHVCVWPITQFML